MQDNQYPFEETRLFDRPEIRSVVNQFEQALDKGLNPKIEDYLSGIDVTLRRTIISELIEIEIEYCGDRKLLIDTEQFFHRFPELKTDELCVQRLRKTFERYVRQNQSTNAAADISASLSSTVIQSPSKETRDPVRLGDYEILGEIARGGMGVVYKARHVKLGRLAALKLIKSGELADTEQIQRFHDEAKAAAHLDHPAIVPVFEAGEHQGQHFMALAFVDGASLWSRIKESPLEPKHAARIVQQVSEAIQYAHDHGVVHRDLKPQNILLTKVDQPRVTDFGLAKHQAADSNLTVAGNIMGTPSYMPPEQARGDWDHVGPLSDVYSLGATLYCAMTGRPPFQAANSRATCEQVISSDAVSPRMLNPAVDRDLETICLKCLQKESDRRYASAQLLADDLGRFLRDEPILARPVSRLEHCRRWCRRNPTVSALACLLVIATSWGAMAIWQMGVEKIKRLESDQQASAEKLKASEERAAKNKAEADKKLAQVAEQSAKQEAHTAATVSSFYSGLFLDLDPLRVVTGLASEEPAPATLTVGDIIERGAKRAKKFAADSPLTQAALMDNIGHVMRSRSDYEQAEPLLKQALELRKQHLPADDLDLAKSYFNYGCLLQDIGQYTEAQKHLQWALDIQSKFRPDAQHQQEHDLLIAATEAQLGWVVAEMGDGDTAKRLFQKVYDTRKRILNAEHRETQLAQAYLIAVMLRDNIEQGKLIELLRSQASLKTLAAFFTYQDAVSKREAKDFAASANSYQEVIRLATEHFGNIDHPVLALLYGDLAGLYNDQLDLVHAQAAMEKAVRLGRRTLRRHPKIPPVLLKYAEALDRLGRYDEAERWLHEAIAIADTQNKDNFNLRFGLRIGLARLLKCRGEFSQAVQIYEQAISHLSHEQSPQDLSWRFIELGEIYLAGEQFEEAETAFQKAIKLADDHKDNLVPTIFRAKLAGLFRLYGKVDEAQRLTQQVLTAAESYLRRFPAPGRPISELRNISEFVAKHGAPGQLASLVRLAIPEGAELYYRTDVKGLISVARGETWSVVDHAGKRATFHPETDGSVEIPEWNLTGKVDGEEIVWSDHRWQPAKIYLFSLKPKERNSRDFELLRHAEVLEQIEDWTGARKIYDDVREVRRLQKESPPFQAELDIRIGRTLIATGNSAAAVERLTSALAVHRQYSGESHPIIGELLLDLAKAHQQSGQADLSAEFARDAVANRRESFGDDHPLTKQMRHLIHEYLQEDYDTK